MKITPQLYTAQIVHRRLSPKIHQFKYGIYYLVLPLSQLSAVKSDWRLGINRPALVSFYEKDNGPRDGGSLEIWGRNILRHHGLDDITQEIVIVGMPRVLGYVFSPASFWLCLDKNKKLRAVISQLSNTSGEAHHYLCMHEDRRPIFGGEHLRATKVFYMSPFIKREGYYRFHFSLRGDSFSVNINYCDTDGDIKLKTSLNGKMRPLNQSALWRLFLQYPLVTLKIIAMFHWQALKLMLSGLHKIDKPQQHSKTLSTSEKKA